MARMKKTSKLTALRSCLFIHNTSFSLCTHCTSHHNRPEATYGSEGSVTLPVHKRFCNSGKFAVAFVVFAALLYLFQVTSNISAIIILYKISKPVTINYFRTLPDKSILPAAQLPQPNGKSDLRPASLQQYIPVLAAQP